MALRLKAPRSRQRGFLLSPYRFGSASPTLPSIADDNAVFNDEGGSTTGWTGSNATVSTDGTYVRETKGPTAGSSSSMTKSLGGFVSTDQDYIIYGKMRSSTGANHIGVMWILNGSKEVSIWFGSANASTTYTGGAVSICGTTGASTRNVASAATGLSYDTTPVEFALQFDKKFGQLNCFFKESGLWKLKTRVACDWFSASDVSILNTSGSPNGAWTEFDHLSLCRANLVAIGDSICAGATLFNPDRALGLSNDLSSWMHYTALYPSLRNTLIINKGVGSQTSTQIDARIAEATGQGARVVFLHASTNDEAGGLSQATRTTNIQNSVNSITGSGAGAVLLNALYGTSTAPDNTPTPDLRDYMLDWWSNYQPGITGLSVAIDIMQPLLSAGFMNPALAQSDGLHPTPTGYNDIYDYIATFA